MKSTVEMVMENLIGATLGERATARQKHLFRESLRSLVRLAKAEQLIDMKTSVKKLTGAITAHAQLRQAKVNLLLKDRDISGLLQREFEFDQYIQRQSNPTCDRDGAD